MSDSITNPQVGDRTLHPVVGLPNGPFRVILADPPWSYLWGTGKDGGNFAPEKHYAT